MQGAKSTYGMASCSHSVWCKCQRGEQGPQHRYPDQPMASYDDMLNYIENTVGCQIKTHAEMCAWGHYSPGIALGGRWTRFKCSCCTYSPTEAQWRRDLAAYHAMSDDERKAAQAKHRDTGDELNEHLQHYHQDLFTPPSPTTEWTAVALTTYTSSISTSSNICGGTQSTRGSHRARRP